MNERARLGAAPGLLALHLVLSPLLFSVFSSEVFEFPKALAARLVAIALLAVGATLFMALSSDRRELTMK